MAIGRPELADDARFSSVMARQANYEVLTAELQASFGTRPLAEWTACLLANDIPHAPVASLAEVYADAQVQHNGIFKSLHHQTQGDVMNTQRPVLYDGARDAGALAPPTLGEHSRQVLEELGFDAAAVASMLRDGVIGSSPATEERI